MRKLTGVFLAFLALVVVVQVLLVRRQAGAPAQNPPEGKIVSLAPNLTGLLFRLGVGDRLAGVTNYCDDPPQAREITSIGDFLNPNFERISSLHPQLVLAESWSSSRSVQRLRQLGLVVREVPSPRSIAEIERLIVLVGEIVGASGEAHALIQEMEQRIEAVRQRGKAFARPPRVYLEIDLPTWTIGGPSFTSEAIELCGARNVFADLELGASQISAETVVQRDPEVIVSFVATRREIAGRPGWSGITAVREGRVIDDFDENLLSRANHRIVDGMEAFQTALLRAMGRDPLSGGPDGGED